MHHKQCCRILQAGSDQPSWYKQLVKGAELQPSVDGKNPARSLSQSWNSGCFGADRWCRRLPSSTQKANNLYPDYKLWGFVDCKVRRDHCNYVIWPSQIVQSWNVTWWSPRREKHFVADLLWVLLKDSQTQLSATDCATDSVHFQSVFHLDVIFFFFFYRSHLRFIITRSIYQVSRRRSVPCPHFHDTSLNLTTSSLAWREEERL